MSGPKIVRIVSLEEKQATVKKHQRQLLYTSKKLLQFAQDNQQVSPALTEALDQRQAEYAALDANNYSNIETFAAEQVSFLNAKLETLESDLVNKIQQRKHQVRKIKMAARGLQKAFFQRELDVPETLIKLTHLPLETSVAALSHSEQLLQANMQTLMGHASLKHQEQPLSAELQSLQSRLGAHLESNDSVQPLTSWINTQQPATSIQQQRLDKLLSRLEIIRAQTDKFDVINDFIVRTEALESPSETTSASQQALLTDSLILEVSHFIQAHQTYQDTIERLEQHLLTLLDVENNAQETGALILQIQRALADSKTEVSVLALLEEQAESYLEKHHTQLAADSRRDAVLQGLQALGYQVNENMSSAWVEDGRLVVRRAQDNDYGIELTTNHDMQRLQARVVVNSGAEQRSHNTDTQAEEAWCGDFAELKQIIQAHNGQLIIDKALPIGSQKLKEISQKTQADEERQRGYRQQTQLRSRQQ